MKSRFGVTYSCALVCIVVWVSLAIGSQHARTAQQAAPTISEIRVSPAADGDPRDETAIAVNPRNNRNIVGASKVIIGATGGTGVSRVGYYFSSDAGVTWGTGLLELATPQKIWNRASDPSVAVDSFGNFYICVLMLDESGGTFDTGIYIYKSTDGGRTFGTAEPVVFDIGHTTDSKRADKCYLTIDPSGTSPFKNTLYVVWISSEPQRTVILAAHRHAGETSFSDGRTISHSGTMLGPALATGPNGELYCVWLGLGQPRVMLFNASTDGGDTFFPPIIAHPDFNIYRYVGILSDPPIFNGVRRINSFPAIDVDRSNGPNRGMIYIAWAERINGVDGDVFIQKLTPPNASPPGLSNRVRVNNDQLQVDQFFPWISVDSSSGAVEVVFYDRRDEPGNLSTHTYLARSTDGGATFSENLKVTAQPSNPTVQANVEGSFGNQIGIGDYIGIAAVNGTAHLLWTDTRSGKQEIFYSSVVFEPSGGGGGGPANDDCQPPQPITFTPFEDTLDTTSAKSSPDDPQSCTGATDSNTVWYSITPPSETVYAVDTLNSNYDTVLSVYTGTCGALTRIACNDNFQGTRSLLTFAANAGQTYLIEASGKAAGGSLGLRVGFPTITDIQYTTAPDNSMALKITGAGFANGSATVTVNKNGVDTVLPTNFFTSAPHGDGTVTEFFATKKKLKKLVKKGQPVVVTIESPAGSGRTSIPFTFTR